MTLDISKVEFSRKDINDNITIPNLLTKELAYLMGIHLGDGSMNIYKRKNCNSHDYKIGYSGHLIDEMDFHKETIRLLFELILIKKTKISLDERKRHSSLRTYLTSKAILTFFHYSLGLPLGPKTNCDIPRIIKFSDIKIKKSFIKGLADTEFCLTFKKRYREKHYYPAIKFETQSKYLAKSVIKILKELGFKLTTTFDYVRYRNGVKTIINTINLNGLDNLNLWMKEIDFNSTKHLTKYEVWKRFGFCPPQTNILERQKILKGEIDINFYYKAP